MAQVILVDEKDQVLGFEEKLKAHQEGKLHRAFSILIFDDEGKMLLQKRALGKYHCAGLWSNACCSHPSPNETLEKAIHGRLLFEMGFDCTLSKKLSFIYKTQFDNGLIEHEFDHVFTGIFSGTPNFNPEEVSDYKWITIDNLRQDIVSNPQNFTVWFTLICQKLNLI
ncbi:MAG: isopentenyl-diphosphate Delta-isomerase [Emticicia sp.]|uniref:isopentenyl-diphosphate Delta-isomerase n=1 Tax=Emticicia sp. TaxID=1930953 RepID=UPI003BA6A195